MADPLEHDSIILARKHLAHLNSWNQIRWIEDGTMRGGEHTATITVIECLLDRIEELEQELRCRGE